VYAGVVQLRGWLYECGVLRTYESKLAVVSVGNVTAGGNGKTPLCLCIAQELLKHGVRPVVLSRGYGGSSRGPRRVRPGDDVAVVGDEPLLMAQSADFPVYIARSRVAGARLIEREQPGSVIILDDGFQHRALAREVDLVSIFVGSREAVDLFIAGELLPVGRFREARSQGLRRADVVVLAERRVLPHGQSLPALDNRLLSLIPPGVSVYRSFLEPVGVSWLVSGAAVPTGRVVACAGIAQPQGFFDSLRGLGFELVEECAFADHHPFRERDLQELLDRHPGVPVVCTEKDAVKMRQLSAQLQGAIATLRVRLKVVPSDAFIVQILRRIRAKVRSDAGLPSAAVEPCAER
jgi:tetraacyldisaccharide 4'-kinase